MIYQSNLRAPDLRPYFKLLDPPRQHCGYDYPSDPDFDPRCGFWTCDEAAILYTIAKSVPPGTWVDIGARLGWTAAHVAEAGHRVKAIDPELINGHYVLASQYPVAGSFYERFLQNTERWKDQIFAHPFTFAENMRAVDEPDALGERTFDGFVIDGCHDSPEPLNDAMGAYAHAKPDCIILFHDFLGPAVRDGVRWLMDHEPWCDSLTLGKPNGGTCDCGRGWHCRVYWTPNGVACCWRGHLGEFGNAPCWMPPDHTPDPAMDFRPHKAAMVDFEEYWSRCE